MSGHLTAVSRNFREIKSAVSLTDFTQMTSFFGVCNAHRRIVKDFSNVAQPLNDYLCKVKELDGFDLTAEALDIPESLNLRLMVPLSSALPQPHIRLMIKINSFAYELRFVYFHPAGRRQQSVWAFNAWPLKAQPGKRKLNSNKK